MLKNVKFTWLLWWIIVILFQNFATSIIVAQEKVTPATATLIVVGDSLSAGHGMAPTQSWVHLLGSRLQDKGYHYQVINASISGDTTGGGKSRFLAALQKFKPAVVILELGANDGLRGLSLKEMQTNLATMIEQAQQVNAKVLLLGMKIPPNYGKAYAWQFEQIYVKLAAQYQVPLVPFLLEGVADQPALLQEDNMHPTAAAQSRLLETVWGTLAQMLKTAN